MSLSFPCLSCAGNTARPQRCGGVCFLVARAHTHNRMCIYIYIYKYIDMQHVQCVILRVHTMCTFWYLYLRLRMWYCFLPFALLSHCPSPGKFQLLFAGVCFKKMGGSPIKIGCFIMFFFFTNSFDDFGLPRDAPGPGWGRLWRDGEDDDGKVRNCWVDDFHLKGSRMMQRQRKLQKVWKSEARTVALKWDWNRKCIMRWTELSFVGFCNLWQRCVQFAICHPWVCKGEWQTWVLDQWYPSVWYFSKVLNHLL